MVLRLSEAPLVAAAAVRAAAAADVAILVGGQPRVKLSFRVMVRVREAILAGGPPPSHPNAHANPNPSPNPTPKPKPTPKPDQVPWMRESPWSTRMVSP